MARVARVARVGGPGGPGSPGGVARVARVAGWVARAARVAWVARVARVARMGGPGGWDAWDRWDAWDSWDAWHLRAVASRVESSPRDKAPDPKLFGESEGCSEQMARLFGANDAGSGGLNPKLSQLFGAGDGCSAQMIRLFGTNDARSEVGTVVRQGSPAPGWDLPVDNEPDQGGYYGWGGPQGAATRAYSSSIYSHHHHANPP